MAALAGAGLMLVGSRLDWSGVDYSSELDRWLAATAGVLAAVAACAAVYRPRILVAAAAAGVLGLNMAVVNIRDISGHEYEYARYPDASVGVGLYAVLAGACLAFLAGVASLLPAGRRRVAR